MNTVILGATKGMGRSLARLLAERGDQLFLLGRSHEELARSAADLRARSPEQRPVEFAVCDLGNPQSFDMAFQTAVSALERIDTIIVTAAQFASQEALEADPDLCAHLLNTNFTNTVLFCERARKLLLENGGGTLCVFSSVAGDRARTPVVLYGAAKAGLSHYLEGLDHKFRHQGLITVCVKPGFVKTGMTAGLRPPPFAGEANEVAKIVVRAIDRKKPVVYAPGIWALVMLIIRYLPRFLMRRLKF